MQRGRNEYDQLPLRYTDEQFRQRVANKIPNDWEALAIYLGLSSETIASIRGQVKTPTDWALTMLSDWYAGTNSFDGLKQALREIRRMDLVKICPGPGSELDDKTRQRRFMALAERMPTDWRDLGIYLNISMAHLDTISKTQVMDDKCNKTLRVLEACVQEATIECTVGQLKGVLDNDMRRRDVAMFIDSELQSGRGLTQHGMDQGDAPGHLLNNTGHQSYQPQEMPSVDRQQESAAHSTTPSRNVCEASATSMRLNQQPELGDYEEDMEDVQQRNETRLRNLHLRQPFVQNTIDPDHSTQSSEESLSLNI